MDSGGVAFHVLIYIGVCGAASPRFVWGIGGVFYVTQVQTVTGAAMVGSVHVTGGGVVGFVHPHL